MSTKAEYITRDTKLVTGTELKMLLQSDVANLNASALTYYTKTMPWILQYTEDIASTLPIARKAEELGLYTHSLEVKDKLGELYTTWKTSQLR